MEDWKEYSSNLRTRKAFASDLKKPPSKIIKANGDRFTVDVKHFYMAKNIRNHQINGWHGKTFPIYMDKSLRLLLHEELPQKGRKQRSSWKKCQKVWLGKIKHKKWQKIKIINLTSVRKFLIKAKKIKFLSKF